MAASKELEVFTIVKKFNEYLFSVIRNTPREYRWNIVAKINDAAEKILRLLYMANELAGAARLGKQRESDMEIKLMSSYIGIANNLRIFNNRQTRILIKYSLDIRRALWKWINGEKNKN
jgi:hypothetical protein